jgi:hypothetical protein
VIVATAVIVMVAVELAPTMFTAQLCVTRPRNAQPYILANAAVPMVATVVPATAQPPTGAIPIASAQSQPRLVLADAAAQMARLLHRLQSEPDSMSNLPLIQWLCG